MFFCENGNMGSWDVSLKKWVISTLQIIGGL
jgi:hypothetical protein